MWVESHYRRRRTRAIRRQTADGRRQTAGADGRGAVGRSGSQNLKTEEKAAICFAAFCFSAFCLLPSAYCSCRLLLLLPSAPAQRLKKSSLPAGEPIPYNGLSEN